MPARTKSEPPIRKSFLVMGGIALAAALLGFLVTNFAFGGDDFAPEEADQISITEGGSAPAVEPPPPAEPVPAPGLTEGGRDPFSPTSGFRAPPPAPPTPEPEPAPAEAVPAPEQPTQVQGATVQREQVELEVVRLYGGAADVRIGDRVHEGVRPGAKMSPRFQLASIIGECVRISDEGERFEVCQGQSVTR